MVKQLATAGLCAVILAAVLLAYRYSRRAGERPGGAGHPDGELPAAALVLPAVSPLWTNIGTRTSTRPVLSMMATQRQIAMPVSASVTQTVNLAPSLNSLRVQARARELLARATLDSVGLDTEADRYWLVAVSDGNLGGDERRELIMALAQAGLPDWSLAGSQDLPLIASRLALIEEAAPNAIDSGTAAAFQEAHQALFELFEAVSGADLSNTAQPLNQ